MKAGGKPCGTRVAAIAITGPEWEETSRASERDRGLCLARAQLGAVGQDDPPRQARGDRLVRGDHAGDRAGPRADAARRARRGDRPWPRRRAAGRCVGADPHGGLSQRHGRPHRRVRRHPSRLGRSSRLRDHRCGARLRPDHGLRRRNLPARRDRRLRGVDAHRPCDDPRALQVLARDRDDLDLRRVGRRGADPRPRRGCSRRSGPTR